MLLQISSLLLLLLISSPAHGQTTTTAAATTTTNNNPTTTLSNSTATTTANNNNNNTANNNTTTATATTTVNTSTITPTTESAPLSGTTTEPAMTTTGEQLDPCDVLRIDLRQAFDADASLTVKNEACDFEAVLTATGGNLRCRESSGCGVGAATRKRQMQDATYELNQGSDEKILIEVSKPALLWRASFGEFAPGIDSVSIQVTGLFDEGNATSVINARALWGAIDVIVEQGIELPVTKSVIMFPADQISSFSVAWVEFKPYVTLPPTPAPSVNATTTVAATEEPDQTYNNFVEEYYNTEPLYFWLVVGAIIFCCLACCIGIFCKFCVSFGDDDDDDDVAEAYSMRDMGGDEYDFI